MRGLIRFTALLLSALLSAAVAASEAAPSPAPARTYQLSTIAVVRDAPDGRIIDVWDSDTLFTARAEEDGWLRVSGHFPGDKWQPLAHPLWISRYYAHDLTTARAKRHDRFIVVDKSKFLIKVVERKGEKEKVLYKARVALGMDGCRPKDKGGNCYYTEPGEYEVRWKIHDPKGIEWCIPKFMEKEYPDDIAAGQRCFRGPLGSYALNIGKSYAIHGTNRPQSLGKKVSHGCIRVANHDMSAIYRLSDVGDKVLIVE